jgi:uncharacterized surface protein with fasciclin (FAS1) repeats
MERRTIGIGAILLAGTVILAACSSSGASSAPTAAAVTPAPTVAAASPDAMASPSADAMASPAASASAGAMSDTFGAACSTLPTTGAGSLAGMAKDPVATAASNNPALSTLVTAVKAAGLVDTLNTADGITVFAPVNDAFTAMDQTTLTAALADPKGLLTTVLTFHVVAGKLSPDQLAGTHKTLLGKDLTVTGSGTDFTVNGKAKIVCGNIQTANATVYLLDSVLLPPAN